MPIPATGPGPSPAGGAAKEASVPAFSRLPEPLRPLRDGARQAIRLILAALPLALGWLAHRAGMGWELVSLLGAVLALAAWRPRGAAGRAMLAAALAAGCVLAQGAGQFVLAPPLATALPYAALLLAALLCDARALAACLAVLLAACAPALAGGTALALALTATAAWLAQHLARHLLRRGAVVLAPGTRPAPPLFSRPQEGFPLPGLLVQAERTPEGAVRLAVAAPALGRMRVSVR